MGVWKYEFKSRTGFSICGNVTKIFLSEKFSKNANKSMLLSLQHIWYRNFVPRVSLLPYPFSPVTKEGKKERPCERGWWHRWIKSFFLKCLSHQWVKIPKLLLLRPHKTCWTFMGWESFLEIRNNQAEGAGDNIPNIATRTIWTTLVSHDS